MGVGNGNDLSLTRELHFPHSIGLLYSAFTAFLGFEVNEGEYKVMGMAPYGEPKYIDQVWEVVQQETDGAFRLNSSYFSMHHSTRKAYTQKFIDLFGVPARIFRISFSGELAYEINVESGYGVFMWEKIMELGKEMDIEPYGTEALSTLRIEMGHVAGSEIDGRTIPSDLSLDGMLSKKRIL